MLSFKIGNAGTADKKPNMVLYITNTAANTFHQFLYIHLDLNSTKYNNWVLHFHHKDVNAPGGISPGIPIAKIKLFLCNMGMDNSKTAANKDKKLFSFSNLSTAVLICVALALVFLPDFKGWTMQGLMKIGLFQPNIPEEVAQSNQNSIPDVAFIDGANKSIRLSDLKGKVVFLNFWATWCPPCIAEMPAIQKLYNQFKDNENVAFLLVDADGNYAKSSAFMKRKKYSMPVVVPNSAIPDIYFKGSLPTTVIFDKKGRIVFNHAGAADYGNPKVAEFINKLLK
jgi:thiol-disulfide isomerase/thioredoxin